jgi:hypothetical protein
MTPYFSVSARFRRGAVALLGLLAAALVVGCETPPPPPQALTVIAQKGQSQAQQDRDSAECQSMASAQANSSGSWAQIFDACMGGRGYLVR